MTTEVSPTPDEQGQTLSEAVSDALSQGATAESPPADVGSDSSPEAGANKSLLDVAREALAPAPEMPEETTSASPAEEEGQETESEPEPTDGFTDEELGLAPEKDPDEAEREDLEKLPFHKHPRFKELLNERNEYRSKVQEFEADAGQYRTMRKYLDQVELSEEDAAKAIVLMAQVKHAQAGRYDAEKVLTQLDELRSSLAMRAGKALPPDIQERLDEGLIDDETAKELAQARLLKQQAEESESKLEVRNRSDETRERIKQFTETANKWEAAVKARDPDYDLKRDAIADYVRLLRQERGNPATKEEVMILLRDAYQTVNKRYGSMTPRPQPKAPGLTSDRSHAPEAPTPEPKTLLDAARLGLQRARSQSL